MIEYFADNLWQLWALVAIACLIIELTNGDFYVMCFSIGALLTVIVSLFAPSFYLQLFLFVLFSVLCIFFVRPFALKYLHGNRKDRLSNADALIGRIGRVSETIVEGGYGRVAIDGDDWKAVTANGESIALGNNVRVVGRESIIITVEKV
ncbi:NfeD family protein [Prevotella sp.]|uniref:NfeD family protein n=1 Tax=Prevotella sp. TaxID=59823 RepID=UPI003AB63CF8